MSALNEFLELLFDAGEATCYTKDPKGTSVFNVGEVLNLPQKELPNYFSINPLLDYDKGPTKDYHDPQTPRRADCNVALYRNILIEIDSVPHNEQLGLIESMGLPFSSAVYSGGKSVHFIISLDKPLYDEKQYRALVDKIYRGISQIRPKLIDSSCKNPSRLSRLPLAMRGNVEQSLLKLNKRVSMEELNAWFKAFNVKDTPERTFIDDRPALRKKYGFSSVKGNLSGFSKNVLMFGAPVGERNVSCFRVACDMARNGYEIEEAISQLGFVIDLPASELNTCIRNAFNRVLREETW